jgi:dTDP-4-dehydrorhamnose 3,5-epimerase-like enzyme
MALEFVTGGIAFDDRGSVSFINDFKVSNYKRFYLVSNHKQGFIRAWHGHKQEAKAVVLLQGAALVCGVEIDNWESPSPDLEIHRYVLTASKPGALIIPAGFANGFMNLTNDAILCFYSTSTVEESMNDDIRFDSRFWNPWNIEEK